MKISLGANPMALPCPVWAICTYDNAGNADAMIAAWGGIASSKPASVSVAVRPARHTYQGLETRKAFTVCVPDVAHAAQADYLGMESGARTDKFAASGLTAIKSDCVDAPVIKEFPVWIECVVSGVHDLGAHHLFIGEIKDVKINREAMPTAGKPDLERIQPLIFTPGTQSYHGVGEFVGRAFSMGDKYR